MESVVIVNKPANNCINVGETYESLGAKEMPTDAWIDVEWYSGDENIAEIYYDYAKGRVVLIGKSQGSVWIGAESSDSGSDASDGFWLYVELIPVKSFGIDYHPDHTELKDEVMYVGELGFLKAEIYPEDPNVYYHEIEWYVNNGDANNVEFIGAIDKGDMKLRFKEEGTYEIGAKIDGKFSTNTYTITVIRPSDTITNKPTDNTIYKGGTHALGYTVDPETATVEWVSSNKNVATIDATGKITAKAVGNTTISIKATYNGSTYISDSFTLTVDYPPVESIKITNLPTNNSLCVGETHDLDFEITPFGALQEAIWESDDMDVIEVHPLTGKLTAKKVGIANITVTAECNGEKAEKAIEVKPLLIYQTEDQPVFDYIAEDGNHYTKSITDDMLFNNQTISYNTYPSAILIRQWRDLCSQVTKEPLTNVGMDMIDHFIGEETTNFIDSITAYDTNSKETLEYNVYQNSILTQKALQHESTINYLNTVKELLTNVFNTNPSSKTLKYNFNTPYERENSTIVKAMKGTEQPVFNGLTDKITGLTFCIDSLWGHKMELISYEKSDNKYTAKVKLTFYDHFGLDSADINKYDWPGFNAWYVLQHAKRFNGQFKPFVTVFSTNIMLTGNSD